MSKDPGIVRAVQASAATVARSVWVVDNEDDLRGMWRRAPAVIIGADQLERCDLGLPQRNHVYLLGMTPSEDLCQWSVPLHASVVTLSQGSSNLATVIAGSAQSAAVGMVIQIAGGSGGVGVSTLCGGLCASAVRRKLRVALVDGDPMSGGIDLMMGAEKIPGWRWPKLAGAAGQLADITTMLPMKDEVIVLSGARTDEPFPSTSARRAVVESLARHCDLVVVDAGRGVAEWESMADRSLIQVNQSVAGVAAAHRGFSTRRGYGAVVRKTRGVPPAQIAASLGFPLAGTVPTVKSLPSMADQGMPPEIGGAWGRACSKILDWCIRGNGDDA